MAITTRADKGAALTHAELDENFTDLRDNPDGVNFPSNATVGIKVDTNSPVFPWHDLNGFLYVDESDLANAAPFTTYRGGIKARQFQTENGHTAFVDFHIPHDYVANTAIHVHVHWSHTNTNVTGGSVTWGVEAIYSKGHNQSAFSAPVTVSINQTANVNQYTHMIAEAQLSTVGGSAVSIDTAQLETDGIIQARVYLDSNDLTVSSNTAPAPFVHFVDVHYQSKEIGSKNKAPDFYA